MTARENDTASEPATPTPPSRRILLLVSLGLLLAGLIVAVVAAIYRPDYVVLVHMDDAEEAWFRARIAGFAEKRHIRLTTRSYKDGDELERLLRAEALGRKPRVLLAMTPQSMLTTLVEEDLIRSIEDVVGRPRARALMATMAAEATAPAFLRDQPQYVPATLSTPLLFWSKARVGDAFVHWEEARPLIESALREVNGGGLPRGYRLEKDPNEWDTYDLAVVATYWATRPHGGLTVPRIAHAATGEAAALDLASRAYSQGARSEELLSLDGVPLRDALAWESFFFRRGLYHPSMIAEAWEPGDLLTAAAQGQIFLGWLDSPHLFRLHGSGEGGRDGFLREPSDLGVSRIPRGVSLELERGSVARAGDPHPARGGAWWGIPRTAPDATLAGELAQHLAEREFQQDWARAHGHLPARRDLLAEIDLVFEEDWQFAIARVAKKQALDSGRALPSAARWRRVAAGLVGAWHEACVVEHRMKAMDLGMVLQRAAAVAQGAAAPRPAAPGAGDTTNTRGD